jgi:hypothetical protein
MLTLKKRPGQQETTRSSSKPAKREQQPIESSSQEDEIRPLAYQKWEEAGCPASDGVEFWLAAEAEILHGE